MDITTREQWAIELYDSYSTICYRQLIKNVPEEKASKLLVDVFELALTVGFDYRGQSKATWMLRMTNAILKKHIPLDEIKY
jgi:hypothetical protein